MTKIKLDINIRPFFAAFALFIFVLPLLVNSTTNELYEYPKMYFIYFVGGTIIAAFLVSALLLEQKLRRVPIYTKLFLLSFVVSSLFSVHTYTSFWGYYSRFNDCLMATLIFFGLYYVAFNKFTKFDFEQLFKLVLFALVPISVVAIVQHITLTRVYSTFGQPNWLAQFFAMFVPLANYLYFTNRYTAIWALISTMGFAGLWFTYSLSGISGYLAALALLIILFGKSWFFTNDSAKNRYKLGGLLLIYAFIAMTNLGVFKQRVDDVLQDTKKVLSSVEKVFAQDNSNAPVDQRNLSDTGFIRTGLWQGSFKLLFSSPKIVLIGTGPETYPYAFQKFRPRELNYSSEWNFVFNKPHNYFLEVATEQGLLGLIIYIFMLVQLFRKLPKKYLPILTALVVTNLFGWPTVFTTFIFWLLLASLETVDA